MSAWLPILESVEVDGRTFILEVNRYAKLALPWGARVRFSSQWRGEAPEVWNAYSATHEELIAALRTVKGSAYIAGVHGETPPPAMQARRDQLDTCWKRLVERVRGKLVELDSGVEVEAADGPDECPRGFGDDS